MTKHCSASHFLSSMKSSFACVGCGNPDDLQEILADCQYQFQQINLKVNRCNASRNKMKGELHFLYKAAAFVTLVVLNQLLQTYKS